jgi:hypothetical protein
MASFVIVSSYCSITWRPSSSFPLADYDSSSFLSLRMRFVIVASCSCKVRHIKVSSCRARLVIVNPPPACVSYLFLPRGSFHNRFSLTFITFTLKYRSSFHFRISNNPSPTFHYISNQLSFPLGASTVPYSASFS